MSYVVDALEASTLAGSTITSLFWLGLMLGRAACARLSQRMDYLSLTAWMGGLAGGACIASLLVLSTSWLGFFIFAAGVLAGGIFPTVVAYTGDVFPGNVGAATGFIIAVCALGGALVPAVVGVLAQGAGMRLGLAPAWLALLGVCWLARIAGRAQDQPASTIPAP